MNNNQSLSLYDSYNVVLKENENKEKERLAKLQKEREDKEKSLKEYTKFLNTCKSYFIVEGMMNVINNSMSNNPSIQYDKNICRNLILNFVNESGPDLTLLKMSETTCFLSEMANIIYESVESVEESCNKEDHKTFKIKNSINTDFFDKLNMATDTQLTKCICDKIQKGTEEYMEGVMQDKKNMEETANKIKEKVDSLKTKDESVKESYYKLYESRINESRKARPKGLLETLIYNISRKSIKDESLRESFTTGGKLDIDKVEKAANSIYITLEAMNTTRFREFDKDLFRDIVKGTIL